MSDAQVALQDREIDRSQMKVSDEVAIEISGMNKWYGTFHVLRDINLTVNRGERIVICGPSGSGKSTTLAAMIDKVNREKPVHILTIEDPVEYLHTHKKAMVNQRELHADTLSFPNALRSLLREDPDVVLIG